MATAGLLAIKKGGEEVPVVFLFSRKEWDHAQVHADSHRLGSISSPVSWMPVGIHAIGIWWLKTKTPAEAEALAEQISREV